MNDVDIARKYVSKSDHAADSGVEFSLTFQEFKRVVDTNQCYYTGISFEKVGPKLRTIDRIDCNKGYIKGNVVACLGCVNSLKAVWENPQNPLTTKYVGDIIGKLI